jgi:hypothetical protein
MIQIELVNFGPISKFTIDLEKDFHLLVGENNIGKSYATTAVYLIVKSLLEFAPRSTSLFGFNNFFIDELSENKDILRSAKEITDKIKNNDAKDGIDVTSIITRDTEKLFSMLLIPKLKNSLTNTFSSIENLYNRYSEKELEIRIITDGMSLCIGADQASLFVKNIKLNKVFFTKKSARNIDAKFNATKSILYFCEGRESDFPTYYFNTLFRLVLSLFIDFSKSISSVHYLPASRSGLYQALSAFGQIVAELSKNRSFLSKKIELPGISEPVSDYFIRLSDIRVSKKSYEDKKINQIAKKIEDEILKGKIEFNPQTKQLMFYPDDTNLKLELSSTSSMVSELAPIVSYLRYVLTQPRGVFRQKDANKYAKTLIMT